MNDKLIRVCNNKERYYNIYLYRTLFGYFCVERIYGSSKNKTYTGAVREFFDKFEDAQKNYLSIIKTKISKGYHKICI